MTISKVRMLHWAAGYNLEGKWNFEISSINIYRSYWLAPTRFFEKFSTWSPQDLFNSICTFKLQFLLFSSMYFPFSLHLLFIYFVSVLPLLFLFLFWLGFFLSLFFNILFQYSLQLNFHFQFFFLISISISKLLLSILVFLLISLF